MSGFLGPESRFGHKRKVLDQQGYEAKPSFWQKGDEWQGRGIAIAYRATGFSWNSVENINSLRVKFEFLKTSKFSTDR
jgi:hypothetical protein